VFFATTLESSDRDRRQGAGRSFARRRKGFIDGFVRKSVRFAEAVLIVGELALLTAAALIFSLE
jgi:hypothetical protein